jgi:hypothetical protein
MDENVTTEPDAASRRTGLQSASDELRELSAGTSLTVALDFFDSLPAVTVEEMIGAWRGRGLDTDHVFDGLLERFGWHGKRFDGPDQVHPLVFDDGQGGVFSVNPAFMPVQLMLRFSSVLRSPVVARAFQPFSRLARTTAPRARLRTTVYRGVATATMCYDALPIHDVFRRVDENTLLGAMDMRGMTDQFMFVLERET